MLKAYKYRLNPNNNQKLFFEQSFGCCRFIYNWALDKKIKAYQEDKTRLSAFDIMNELPELKKTEGYEWLKTPSNECLQQSIKNMDTAFTNFFREKKGFPKFKSKKQNKNSYKAINNFEIDFVKHKVKLPKIGWVNFFDDGRRFDGKIGTVTVSRNSAGYYFISILVENGKPLPQKTNVADDDKTVGIDVGLKTFATLSDGTTFENPKHFHKKEKKLKVHQKRLSKKVKGSNRWKRQKHRVAKIHYEITCSRNFFLHNLTTNLVRKYDTIVIEDLNVDGMLKNHCLAKSIQSVAWSEFFRQLDYKCEWSGKNLVRIGRFEPSSQICSVCGCRNSLVKDLSVREWQCFGCSTLHDRDINASRNIRNWGLDSRNLIGEVERKRKNTPSMRGEADVEGRGYEPVESSISKNLS
jgi:putative transposase